MTERLRLRAEDEEDLRVISACLQDALVAIADLAYLPAEQRFVLVANRFRWEDAIVEDGGGEDAPDGARERVHCGFCVEGVRAARHRGIDRSHREQLLELLAIEHHDGAVQLEFAGGGSIRLEVDRLLCHVRDLDEPWPTLYRPSHPLDER